MSLSWQRESIHFLKDEILAEHKQRMQKQRDILRDHL
jgi:hypothetical protein